jgi:hypothetical protein
MPFHVMPFEKRFLKKWFPPQISSKPLSPQETEHRKKKKKRRKRKKETKLQGSPQIKGEVNILGGEKHFNFKDPFWCDSIFSPSIIPFEKTLSKITEKIFLTLCGPSISLAIYMTWVVTFLFTMSPTYLAYRG